MQEEIIIKIRAEDEATPQIEALARTINKSFSEIGKPVFDLKGFDKISVKGKVMFGDLTDEFLGFRRVMDSMGRFGKTPLRNMNLNLEETKNLWEKLQKPVKNFQNQMDQMDFEPIGDLSDYLNIAGLSQKDFNKYAEQNFLTNIKGVGLWDNLNQRVISYGSAVKQAVLQNRRFQFGWLSIMFAGMALERAFGGIISAQMELYGITAMTTDMWTILMMPAMDKLSTYLYDFINAMMNLPEPIKAVIGWVVFLGYGLGKLMSSLGQIMLFLGGLRFLFPSAFASGVGAIKGFVGALAGLGTFFLAIFAIITIIVIGFFMAWKTNYLHIQEITDAFLGRLKQMFGGVFEILKGIVKFFTAFFTGDFEGAKNAVIQILKGFGNFFTGLFFGFVALCSMITISIIRIFWGMIDTIIGFFRWLWEKIKEGFNWLIEQAKKVWDTIIGIFSKPITQIISVITKTVGGGTKVKDAIITPSGMVYTHPQDYLIATKNPSELIGGKGNITISPIYNIYVSDKREMERLLKDNNIRLVEEVKRMVAV